MQRVERISVRGAWDQPTTPTHPTGPTSREVEADKGWVELAILLGVDSGHIILWRRADGRVQRTAGGTPQRPGRVEVPASKAAEAWRLACAATFEVGGKQVRRPVAVSGGRS